MAVVTINATVSSAEGHKVLLCTVVGDESYNRETGTYIRAGTEVNAVNAIISVHPSAANGGYLVTWVNASNALFVFGVANGAGTGQNPATNGQPLLAAGNSVNFQKVSIPVMIVGEAQ